MLQFSYNKDHNVRSLGLIIIKDHNMDSLPQHQHVYMRHVALRWVQYRGGSCFTFITGGQQKVTNRGSGWVHITLEFGYKSL